MEKLPKRKRLRMENFDYSSNHAYFITICTKDRKPLLWENTNCLSKIGKIVEQAIEEIPLRYKNAEVNKYCIMSDHIHLIIFLVSDGREQAENLSQIIGQMKRYVSKKCGFSIWQKSFVDRVLRNQTSYQAAWGYIESNPSVWAKREADSFPYTINFQPSHNA